MSIRYEILARRVDRNCRHLDGIEFPNGLVRFVSFVSTTNTARSMPVSSFTEPSSGLADAALDPCP